MHSTNDKIDQAHYESMAQTRWRCSLSSMGSTDSRGELAEIGYSGSSCLTCGTFCELVCSELSDKSPPVSCKCIPGIAHLL